MPGVRNEILSRRGTLSTRSALRKSAIKLEIIRNIGELTFGISARHQSVTICLNKARNVSNLPPLTEATPDTCLAAMLRALLCR